MRSVGPVFVNVEVAGPSPCMEPRDCFLDLRTFFKKRFISLMIDVKEKGGSLDYISEVGMAIIRRDRPDIFQVIEISNNDTFLLSWMNYTTLGLSMHSPKILFFNLVPHLRCPY